MVKRKQFIGVIVVLAGLLGALVGGAAGQDRTALVRFVHVIPGLTAIDVYVNDILAVEGLEFRGATAYLSAPVGEIDVRVTLAGLTTTLWQQTAALPSEEAITMIASSINPLSFTPFRDDLTALPPTTARFQFIHAVDGGPALDIVAEGDAVAPNLAYGQAFGPVDTPVGSFTFSALVADTEEVALPDTPFSLAGATTHMLVIYGSPVSPQTLLLAAPTRGDADSGFVRFAHGIADAPSVDVLVNDETVALGLTYSESSEHIPLPAGAYTIAIQVAGGGAEVASTDIEVVAGQAATVVALGSAEAAGLSVFLDDISGVEPRSAALSAINTVLDSTATLALTDGSELVSVLAVGEASETVILEPTRAGVSLELTIGTETQTIELPETTFYGGVYYNLFVGLDADGAGTVFIAPTGLSQALNSAPNSAEVAVVEATPEPTAEPTNAEAVAVAATPDAAATSASTEAPAATAVPVTPTPIPPSPVPTTEFPTGRPLIDSSARLNLRTYPSAVSESRGQLPGSANATLDILGRQSDIEIGENGLPLDLVIPEDGAELGDPFADLAPESDIPATETWLFISVPNPEGGEVTAWVRADFVDVRSVRGEVQRLRDLPLVPANQPGEGQYGERPQAQIEFPEAIVFSLAPDVALIIRERLLPVVGEPLERVFNDTRLELVGVVTLADDTEWAFVRYRPDPDSNTVVSGWASTLYLRYEFRGQARTLDELSNDGLLETVDAAELGGVEGDGVTVVLPTADPFRDRIVATVVVGSDTALQFRPGPDTIFAPTAELSNGTRVAVVSRNGASTWLEVEFEGETGWVASAFVTLSLNERPFNLADVPVNDEFSATPEPTPTATATTEG